MKVFIAGSKGQLGRDCLEVFAEGYEVLGMDLPELDITDAASVQAALSSFRPEYVINCAGHTQVDAAETEREQARLVNVEGSRLLAEYVEHHGGLFVQPSTDYVFNGRKPPPQPYVETDPTGPVCWYGVTKLEGEEAVRRATARHLILRTAWLYSAHGHNFLRTILQAALTRPDLPLRVVNDQFGCPTWSWRLAHQIRKALESGCRGLYHATAEGYCTRYELAREFLRLMGAQREIQPCTTADYPTPARRPCNSILENARLKAEGINVMRAWAEDLAEFVRQHGEKMRREVTGPAP